MPRYAGQLTFMIARLVKVFDEWEIKKSHYISLYLSLPNPLPLFSQEILCNFLNSPQENQDETLRQIEHKAVPIFAMVIYFQNVLLK